jgi:MazG family protein
MSAIDDLRATMARLRSPNGCPWDLEQDHQSLARCLVEECAELLDTIDRLDMAHMREELGDVLLQVVFHAQMAEEKGLFNFDDVAAEINAKLVRRHPHVFGESSVTGSDDVLRQWEEIKAKEKQAAPHADLRKLKDLPPSLPALLYAWDVVKQLQRKNLVTECLEDSGEIERMAADLDEEKAGEMLFRLSAACRLAGIDPESALRRQVGRVIKRAETR